MLNLFYKVRGRVVFVREEQMTKKMSEMCIGREM